MNMQELGASTIDDVVSKISEGGFLRDSFEMPPHGTLLLGPDGNIKYFNPQQARYFGLSDLEAASIAGKILFKDAHFCDADEQKYGLLMRVLSGEIREAKSSQVEAIRGDDRSFYNIVIKPYLDGVRVDMTDVTEEMAKATIDSLTGAFNRAYLDKILMPELGRRAINSKEYRKQSGEDYNVGVVYIDLKEFKQLNDKMGHEAGDQMLRDVVELLRANIKSKDSVVRLGGDEFLIVSEGMNQAGTEALVNRFSQAQEKYNLKIENPALCMNMSIGGISGKAPYNHLIKIAETAMYEQKRSG